ncbi:heterogeneous nuclear ribonucleoprotein l (hnrnp l), putative [Schistosoma mansoni]|uniref:Heterogeneous nuclear ribonucleoprotein l (Hnrnp l), putative n=1 Tax=Schistosoma mansoni TaxID=6183 RepID=C4QB35_SCHMA|nr:heterogeneous nuclear ribonucleoprotein l (hnrnp l), putative [Schistosoma mansoni]|eukprot:XP_018644242.1 heterogeneous nuclear ribonucleoprotein l (hnrnp l), putative [Schistosoma mansoni]
MRGIQNRHLMANRKRNRPEDWEDLEPSPVIHIRELPEHTLELDLIRVFEQFGSIRDIAMIPHKGQALIEFDDINSAERAVARCSENAVMFANHRLKVNYSTSKRVVHRPLENDNQHSELPPESRVLMLTVYNAQYPITVDVIHQITAKHGRVLRIVILRKTRIQAMVEFKNTEEARTAKRHLNGADIYSGCCTLKVEFARPTRLTVTRNDQDSWDFENPLLLSTSLNESDGRGDISLLGRFERSRARHESSRSVNGGSFGYHDGFIKQNAVGLSVPPASFLDQLALNYHVSRRGLDGLNGQPYARASTAVIMVYNMDMDHMNCDRLFNLLCLYGNVVRIKFLRTKEGSAMAQMGDNVSVDRVITNLSEVPLMGNALSIRPSKQQLILDVPKPFELPDGTPSFKDYSGCRENRYINPDKASKNRIYPPSHTLHYWNCPPNYTPEELRKLIVECGASPPRQIAPFPRISDRSSSGLVEWGTKDEAVTALALCNHQAIPNTEGRYPYLLKLSFSSSPVNDRAFSGSKKIGSSTIGKSAASVDSSEYE